MQKSQSKLEAPNSNTNEEKLDYIVRAVGKVRGPNTTVGQETFCIVLGLFNCDGEQAVHTYPDGTQKPIVWFSVPIPENNTGILH